jgi:hypothetical protein
MATQETTNGVWKSLPIWVKGVIIVGGGFLTYRVVNGIIKNSKLNPKTRDSKQEEEGWYTSASQDNATKPATLSKTQMKAISNKIHNIMDGYGTRDYDLVNVFKSIKNNADFSGVAAAYGIKELQPGYGTGWFLPSFKGTMIECIQEDVSSSTIDTINKYLKSKGIKYTV